MTTKRDDLKRKIIFTDEDSDDAVTNTDDQLLRVFRLLLLSELYLLGVFLLLKVLFLQDLGNPSSQRSKKQKKNDVSDEQKKKKLKKKKKKASPPAENPTTPKQVPLPPTAYCLYACHIYWNFHFP